MIIVFPAEEGTKTKIVGTPFEREFLAARKAGTAGVVYKDQGEYKFTFKAGEGDIAIYRGWMLSAWEYETLFRSLWKHGYRLINSPQEYLYCHELPRWYPDFSEATPASVCVPATTLESFEHIRAGVEKALGPGPYIVKDFVKSEKHYWKEACFIPDPEHLEEVSRNFIERRGTLVGGLVYRKFQEFKIIGEHPKSKMPLANEARFFVFKGVPILGFPYWGPAEGGAAIEMPEAPPDLSLTGLVKSDFYTVDIAQLPEELGAGWVIVELGDGQVSGLPDHVEAHVFYERLFERYTFELV